MVSNKPITERQFLVFILLVKEIRVWCIGFKLVGIGWLVQSEWDLVDLCTLCEFCMDIIKFLLGWVSMLALI